MAFLQRRLLFVLVSVVLALIVVQSLQFDGKVKVQAAATTNSGSATQSQTDIPNCLHCATFFGSKHSWMYTATNDWYQQQGNWCGVASIRAIQVYDWLYYNGGNPQWDNSQTGVYDRLNSYTSPWGRGGGYVTSDISGDFGTDPHSVAYGAWYETPPSTQSQPYWFHNWIYGTSALTATSDFSRDFGLSAISHEDPITVMTDGGYHSFVISGVYSRGDPSKGGVVKSVQTWDPWLNHANNSPNGTHPYNQTQEQIWSMTDWTSVSTMWGQAYNTNNGSDPEPDTPINYYNPPFPGRNVPHHWDTYYVTIEQDGINTDTYSADIAIDQNGNPAPHN